MRKWYSIIFFSLLMTLLIGCKGIEQFSPEQVMQNVLATEANDLAYYGEQTITISDAEDTFTMGVKEWRQGAKSLEEAESEDEIIVTLKEGKKISYYDVTENTLFHTEFDHEDELQFNAKDQVETILDAMGKTHDIETKGDTKIAGRPTIHIVAKKRSGEKSLYGTYEMWIDKENWLVLKTISNTGDSKVVMEYTTIEFDPGMDDGVFTLDVPEDVVVETLDEVTEETFITLEKAIEKLGSTFMYFPEENDVEIEEITFYENEEDVTFKNVDIEYNKGSLPYMTLSIYDRSDAEADDSTEEGIDDFTEILTIRGNEAEYTVMDDVRFLDWSEDGLEYSLFLINPNVTLEEIELLVNDMIEIKN